jgi:hypothetical protein
MGLCPICEVDTELCTIPKIKGLHRCPTLPQRSPKSKVQHLSCLVSAPPFSVSLANEQNGMFALCSGDEKHD